MERTSQKWAYTSAVNWFLTKVLNIFGERTDSLFNKWCWENWMSTYWRVKLDPSLSTGQSQLKTDQWHKCKIWGSDRTRRKHKGKTQAALWIGPQTYRKQKPKLKNGISTSMKLPDKEQNGQCPTEWRVTTEWGRVSANYLPKWGLTSGIYKELKEVIKFTNGQMMRINASEKKNLWMENKHDRSAH
jgi:hypothetical protein